MKTITKPLEMNKTTYQTTAGMFRFTTRQKQILETENNLITAKTENHE